MVNKKASDVALIVQELEKARAALTVLYEQSSKDQQDLAAKLAKISQRCKASESRLKRLENTMQGDSTNPGVLTQLWDLKQKTESIEIGRIDNSRSSISNISLSPPRVPSSKPTASISVHPVWIHLVLPSLIFLVAVLGGICVWLVS